MFLGKLPITLIYFIRNYILKFGKAYTVSQVSCRKNLFFQNHCTIEQLKIIQKFTYAYINGRSITKTASINYKIILYNYILL